MPNTEIFQTLLHDSGEATVRSFTQSGKSRIPQIFETFTGNTRPESPVIEAVFRLGSGETVSFNEFLWEQVLLFGLEYRLIRLALNGELSLDGTLGLLDDCKAKAA